MRAKSWSKAASDPAKRMASLGLLLFFSRFLVGVLREFRALYIPFKGVYRYRMPLFPAKNQPILVARVLGVSTLTEAGKAPVGSTLERTHWPVTV